MLRDDASSDDEKRKPRKRSQPTASLLTAEETLGPRPSIEGSLIREKISEIQPARAPLPVEPLTWVIDIGGTGIKCMVLNANGEPIGDKQRQPTPSPATPQAVLACLKEMLPSERFERISIGFPGVVIDGVIRTAPNLHKKWEGFNLQQAIIELSGRPARILNDAGVQGLGVIKGRGVELVLTLGTGMGFALYVNGQYVPNVEMAHHPFRKGSTYEEYIGNAARLKVGNRKWARRVLRVLKQVQTTFNPSVIYIGGGNSAKLHVELPRGVKRVDNIAGLLGGIALWR